MTFLQRLLGVRSDFEQIFFINEYRALGGRNKKTLKILIAILFFTFLALGFAVGSLQNLQTKMANPFTNWVDLPVRDSQIAESISQIEERYEDEDLSQSLNLNNIRGYSRYFIKFHHQDFDPTQHGPDSLLYTLSGRTIEKEEGLIKRILNPLSPNLIWKQPDLAINEYDEIELEDCAIIVTEDLMQRLGYPVLKAAQYLLIREPQLMLVKVVAVVKELPNLCGFVASPKLFNVITAKLDKSESCHNFITANRAGDNSFLVLAPESLDAAKLEELAGRFFTFQRPPSFAIEDQVVAGNKKWQIGRLAFLPTEKPTIDSFYAFLDFVKQEAPIADLARLECGTRRCGSLTQNNYYYLAFNFNHLNRIRAFKKDMFENFGIEIDMSQIESKENFALVSGLTLIICLILLGFGILSTVLFVNNLLRTHLFEVRSNLGTFQAFGLDNRFLNRLYLKIILMFLVISIAISLAAAVVVDRVEQILAGGESKFNIFSLWILVTIISFVLISLLISSRTIKKILGDTPGNLIYKR